MDNSISEEENVPAPAPTPYPLALGKGRKRRSLKRLSKSTSYSKYKTVLLDKAAPSKTKTRGRPNRSGRKPQAKKILSNSQETINNPDILQEVQENLIPATSTVETAEVAVSVPLNLSKTAPAAVVDLEPESLPFVKRKPVKKDIFNPTGKRNKRSQITKLEEPAKKLNTKVRASRRTPKSLIDIPVLELEPPDQNESDKSKKPVDNMPSAAETFEGVAEAPAVKSPVATSPEAYNIGSHDLTMTADHHQLHSESQSEQENESTSTLGVFNTANNTQFPQNRDLLLDNGNNSEIETDSANDSAATVIHADAATSTTNTQTVSCEATPTNCANAFNYKKPDPINFATWESFLRAGSNFGFIPSVDCFKYAPFANVWNEWGVTPGTSFELPNPFVTTCSKPVYWIARVVYFAGYNALVEFESFGMEPKYYAWISYFSDIPKPFGYAASKNIFVYPPHEVAAATPNFLAMGKEESNKNLNVISENHFNSVKTVLEKCKKYTLGQDVEVVDKGNSGQISLAKVIGIIGDRIHIAFYNENTLDGPVDGDLTNSNLTHLHICTSNGLLWYNVNSEDVHPTGWSRTLEIECLGLGRKSCKNFPKLPTTNFPTFPKNIKLQRGQLLEVRHPIQLDRICAASIHKVLKYGYFIVDIRTTLAEARNSIKYIFHITSPYIFPCNFTNEYINKTAKGNNNMNWLTLVPPFGEPHDLFEWNEYLSRLSLIAAPLDLLPQRPANKFKPGMKLEAVLYTRPSILTPATILNIFEHLLLIQYDDFEKQTIWIDSQSPDIYPIGYSQLVDQTFEGNITSPDFNIMLEQYFQSKS